MCRAADEVIAGDCAEQKLMEGVARKTPSPLVGDRRNATVRFGAGEDRDHPAERRGRS